MEIELLGPYSFLPFQEGKPSLYSQTKALKPGIYFWTYFFGGVHWINYIGISSLSIVQRQSAHLASYLSGFYDVYDFDKLIAGSKERLYSPTDPVAFSEHLGDLERQLRQLNVFFAPIEDTKLDELQRIETAFIVHMRESNGAANIFDNFRVSRYRREHEEEIPLKIKSPVIIKGLPESLFA